MQDVKIESANDLSEKADVEPEPAVVRIRKKNMSPTIPVNNTQVIANAKPYIQL